MNTSKTKISVEFKKRLRQEYERLKALQESQEKEIIDVTWSDNRFVLLPPLKNFPCIAV